MAETYLPRLLRAPKQSFFLFGARGSGKSTWVSHAFPAAHRIDLLDESLYQSYLARPGLFADELRAVPRGVPIVVDEVQRLPPLLNEVHRAIESSRRRFILCGSSARKLKRHGTNLLAGRALRREIHPFVPEELGRDFDLDTVLRFGSLPVIWASSARKDALEAYVQLYLKQEIQAEALVRNLAGFARFLPVAALFHAQVLNTTSLARDAQVSRTTVNGYVEILEDTLLGFRLPAYEGRLRVREKKHPKLYWIDSGLVRATKRNLGRVVAEERGALFEGWVANVLRAYREYSELFEDWFYWAPAEAARTEVDFLLKRGREWIVVEAKSAATIGEGELKGLRAVTELRGLVRRVLVHPGERRRKTADGIEILPVAAFLEELAASSLWP